MSIATLIEPDVRLRDAVIQQLDWDPEVETTGLGVSANEGIVVLTGYIDSYAGKLAAERAVKRIRGVRAVVNDVVVRLAQPHHDAEIARDAASAIESSAEAIRAGVQVVVHHGHVTLTGQVDWVFQREAAEDIVRHVKGVLDVHNHIIVVPRAQPIDSKRHIVQALHHDADVDARHIDVTVNGSVVTLTGTVDSWAQHEAATRAAGHAAGITCVHNHLAVISTPHDAPVEEIC